MAFMEWNGSHDKPGENILLCLTKSTEVKASPDIAFCAAAPQSSEPSHSTVLLFSNTDGHDVPWERLDLWRFALFGGLFTVGLDLLIYPLQLVTTKLQIETKSRATLFESVWRTFRTVLKADGFRGFFRGFALFTFGGLPSQG